MPPLYFQTFDSDEKLCFCQGIYQLNKVKAKATREIPM